MTLALLQGLLGLKKAKNTFIMAFMCSPQKKRLEVDKSEPLYHVPADNLRNNLQTLSRQPDSHWSQPNTKGQALPPIR